MSIINTTFTDVCPKMILFGMVKSTVDFLKSGNLSILMSEIYNDERLVEGLMQPNEDAVARVNSVKDEMEQLKKMKNVVQDTADLDAYIIY